MRAQGRRRAAQTTAPRVGTLVAPAAAALLLVLALTLLVVVGRMPGSSFAVYGLFSILAFVSYESDKSAAQQGGRRVPESTLILLGLFGGWPGAFLAQRAYRHKTRKVSFQVGFWLSVAANIAALLWFASQSTATPG